MQPRRALEWGALTTAIALAAPYCFDAIGETDAGFHIAVGRLILRSGIPRTNALSWIARDAPWYPNSWLFDVVCAAVTDRFGLLGLQLFTFLLAVAVLALVAQLLRIGEPGRGVLLLPALALLLGPRLRPRPHLVSWVAIAAVLLLCLLARDRGRRWRWAAVPVVALAGNLHAGAAFAAAVAAIFFLDEWLRTRDARELAGAGAAALSLLANPGGLYDLRYLAAHLRVQEVMPLREFGPPGWPASAFFFFAVPAALFIALWRPREHRPLLALAVIFAALAMRAARMQFEFLIVAAPLLAEGLGMIAAAGPRAPALCALGAACVAMVQTGYPQLLGVLDVGPKFDAAVLPVRAARYVREAGLDGPHFNSFDDGGFLAYALPALPVFVDGRVQAYPESLFARLRSAEGSPSAFDAFLREIGAGWALVQRRSALVTGNELLDRLPGWALVYWDDINEIFVRRDVQRWSSLVAADEFRWLRPDDPGLQRIASAASQELPKARAEVERFERFSPQDSYAAVARCAVAARSGAPGAVCAAALARADYPALRALAQRVAELPPAP